MAGTDFGLSDSPLQFSGGAHALGSADFQDPDKPHGPRGPPAPLPPHPSRFLEKTRTHVTQDAVFSLQMFVE